MQKLETHQTLQTSDKADQR